MNKKEAIEKIKKLEGLTILDKTINLDSEMILKKRVLNIVKQLDEPQKPKVPQVAVEFYERYKDDNLVLGEWFGDFYSNEAIEEFPRMDELTKWLYDNDNETNRQREFALVTLVTLGIDAVEVEKEKLYTVEIPNPNSPDIATFLYKENGKVFIGNEFFWDEVPNYKWKNEPENQLTESEIRKDFGWAWQFAEEVEE